MRGGREPLREGQMEEETVAPKQQSAVSELSLYVLRSLYSSGSPPHSQVALLYSRIDVQAPHYERLQGIAK